MEVRVENGDGEPPIRILVVDDHAISRSGVVQLCSLVPGAEVITKRPHILPSR